MYLFNNALIALNVWNYYRISVDREWLINKGYTILKSCADFFVSRSTIDSSGNYNLNDVMAFNRVDSASNNNSFTNNLVKLALKAVIEASYELGYSIKKEWLNMLNRLPLNISTLGIETYEVVLYDSRSTSLSALNDIFTIIEPLFILTPMMSEFYFSPGLRRGFESVQRNLNFYKQRIVQIYEDNPINLMLLMSMYGVCNKYNKTYVLDLQNILNRYLNNNNNVWEQETNVTLAAAIPFLFLSSLAGINIQGGVSEAKFYYDEMTIKGLYVSYFPTNWNSISVNNCGPMKKSFTVHNQNV